MELIYQPAHTNRLGDYLNDNLLGPWTHFRAAVAFVKRSGTRHIERRLASFTQNHDAEIIVGIDHRGTSYEGLQSLLNSVSPTGRVIVFHNPTMRTFHPKIYLFKSAVAADIVVGSGNLTGGGLFANYEAGLRLRLDLANPDQAAILQAIEEALDRWSDQTAGTARLLGPTLLAQLTAMGLTPLESLVIPTLPGEVGGNRRALELNGFPFTARTEPGAPRLRDQQQNAPATGATAMDQPMAGLEPSLGFVMTLQRTDVGVGQITLGTSRRSPEIFIPLAARNADARFWNWPDGFVDDVQNPGKRDRSGVRMRLGSTIINVNMMTWPAKHDFRLRNESLRKAGNIGDILRIERVTDPNAGCEYYVEVIPQGTTQYPVYLDLCREPVRNSLKRYGYY